jgi:hypothetical protein
MPSRAARTALIVLVVALGLAAVPACKKSKRTTPDSPANPGADPTPGPGPTGGGRDPGAPTSPVLSGIPGGIVSSESENNLKQILIAMHTFNDTYGALPAGYADRTGKPGLSWRVALLPYLEASDIFRQFKLDEPWDSEHNRSLIRQMPAVYAPSRKTNTNGYTFYRGFTGPNTWLPPQQQPGRPGQALLGVTFGQIPDGLSNTLLVAEAYDPVIWTKPDELAFAPDRVPQLGGVYAGGFYVGLADARVKFIKKGSIDSQMLARAIHTSDGGVVHLGD